MADDQTGERPLLRLPYVRTEGAGGSVVWIFGAFAVAMIVFFGIRFTIGAGRVQWGVALVFLVFILGLILDFFLFRERCEIDAKAVRYERKSLFGSTEWTERLANFKGIALVEPKSGDAGGPARSHWSRRKAVRVARLVHRDPEKSITLWEFNETDFREATNHRLMALADLLGVPVLPARGL